MPYFKQLILLMSIVTFTNINSQELDKTSRKVEIFTHQERDYLQLLFHNEVKAMKFTEEELDEYYAVIFYYISKISRLDDLDKEYTQEEFELHNKIYGEFTKLAYKRWGISN